MRDSWFFKYNANEIHWRLLIFFKVEVRGAQIARNLADAYRPEGVP